MPLCAIYRIVNTTSGKVYVGQTWKPLRLRWREHVRHDHCRKLHYAIRAHGEQAFRVELITFTATQEMANWLEAHFIAHHDSIRTGYNIREAGAAGRLSEETKRLMGNAHRGKTISEDTREKLRIANLGKKYGPRSKEARTKMSEAQRGRTFSLEARSRMSAAHLGNKHTPETRAKMSVSHKGIIISAETRAKMIASRKSASPEERRIRGEQMWTARRAKYGPSGRQAEIQNQ
jgi:group I intron endonuclease